MRILMGLVAVAFLNAGSAVTPAAAQCTMYCPNGGTAAKAKIKPGKHATAKKPKRQAKEIYLRAVPY